MSKNRNVELGAEGVDRVIALLQSKIYCTEKVYTNKYSPDLKASRSNKNYGIEVKSLKGVSGGKIGRVTIDKIEWNRLLYWCTIYNAHPYAIFEIKCGQNKFYKFIDGDIITHRMKANGVSFTVWQIFNIGKEDFE